MSCPSARGPQCKSGVCGGDSDTYTHRHEHQGSSGTGVCRSSVLSVPGLRDPPAQGALWQAPPRLCLAERPLQASRGALANESRPEAMSGLRRAPAITGKKGQRSLTIVHSEAGCYSACLSVSMLVCGRQAERYTVCSLAFNPPKPAPKWHCRVILLGWILGNDPRAAKKDSLSLPSGKDTQAGCPLPSAPLPLFAPITALPP